jgi:hypothetical protein
MHQRIGKRNTVYLEEGWVICKNYEEFVNTLITKGLPDFVSFDHDLADEHIYFFFENGGHDNPPDSQSHTFKEPTGYDCAKALISYCLNEGSMLPEFAVHSMNPGGSENIKSILESFKRLQET